MLVEIMKRMGPFFIAGIYTIVPWFYGAPTWFTMTFLAGMYCFLCRDLDRKLSE